MANKIVVVGDARCGKTNVCKKLCGRDFEERHIFTIGVEVHKGKGNDLWDTAGNKMFTGMGIFVYAGGAEKAIMVFDLTNLSSFKKLKILYNDLMMVNHNMEIEIIGNKNDLPNQKVPDQKVQTFMSTRSNIKNYTKMSCKVPDMDNVVIFDINYFLPPDHVI